MVIEFLGGPWDGQIERWDDDALDIGVPMPPDVDYKSSQKIRDYSRVGRYLVRQGTPQHKGIRYADWQGEF